MDISKYIKMNAINIIIITLLTSLISISLYHILFIRSNIPNERYCDNGIVHEFCKKIDQEQPLVTNHSIPTVQQTQLTQQNQPIPTMQLLQEQLHGDIIREYDYSKLDDPLVEPTRRVARHEIQPFYLKNMIDIPTQGYPDNFTQIGLLIKEDLSDKSDTNMLRLFGRQEYPGSNHYEYYAMVNNGHDQVKIPVKVRKHELYEDDVVFVDELNESYRVNLYKFDAPKYYPHIL
jgi:hypothetical protein